MYGNDTLDPLIQRYSLYQQGGVLRALKGAPIVRSLFENGLRTPEERMTQLLRFADRMGIARVVVFMGFPFLQDPTPEQLRRQNDQLR